MVRGLILAVYDDEANLALLQEANLDAALADVIPQSASIEVLGRQGNLVSEEDLGENNLLTEIWFKIEAPDVNGGTAEGWASESRIRIREEAEDGTPLMGTVRRRLGSNADPLTSVYAEPNESSEVVGQLEARVEAQIVDLITLEVWFLVRGENNGEVVEGWSPSRYIQIFEDEVTGRVDRGNAGEFTTKYIEKMTNDRFFWPAMRNTALLLLVIIPAQFVLAIVMALVIQAQLKFNTFILYIFAIPLGVSELAVGILWFAIFTQNGLLNSFLQTVGFIDSPSAWLTADSRNWILVAIWLAEVWRATSIVMVIVVSGLQAISTEVLEAAELFGANLWQRLRYIILPLLRPSLQVALILRTILAFQVFAVVIALSGGDVVTVLANETYRQYFDLRNSNVAAAYAVLILIISMFTAVVYLRAIRTQEEAAA
ncbi:MAG: multiple sugar transport system permease protein [Cellvibrionaceae bacterium]|jgi:multiple sugar transport system permease protein